MSTQKAVEGKILAPGETPNGEALTLAEAEKESVENEKMNFQTQVLILIRDTFVSLGLPGSFTISFGESKQIMGASAATSYGAQMEVSEKDCATLPKKFKYLDILKPKDTHPAIALEKKKDKKKSNVMGIKAIIVQLSWVCANLCKFAKKLHDSGFDLEVTASSEKGISIPIPFLPLGASVSVSIQVTSNMSTVMKVYPEVIKVLSTKDKDTADSKPSKTSTLQSKLSSGFLGLKNKMNAAKNAWSASSKK
ncbi:hypothetical protein AAMO2058_000996200 [Amorphochlora amoebiformis]